MEQFDQTRDRRIAGISPLQTPRELRRALPMTPSTEAVVTRSRAAVAAVLDGGDDRMLAVVGPCSVHDPVAALDYAGRLAAVADRLGRELVVVMRVYVEKPRTTVGWKGLVNDPRLDNSNTMDEGLRIARALLLDVVGLGLPVGCEFLDPVFPQYVADAVSWGAIGARTVLSQVHRQLASGLSMPVGFKNTPDGDVQGAVDAVVAASGPHSFLGITEDGRAAVLSTTGNPDCHVVLRGGSFGPNYDRASVDDAAGRLTRAGLGRRVVVDVSHGNSGKDHLLQPRIAAELAGRVGRGADDVAGVMVESFLVAGSQAFVAGADQELVYGQSITDACIGWPETEALLEGLAAAVRRRRAAVPV